MKRAPHIQSRVDQFAELLSQGLSWTEIKAAMGLTPGEASACMRRIKQDLGPQADAGRNFRCGHPATPENTVGRIKHRCKQCTNAARRAALAGTPKQEKQLDYRVRILPTQLDRARRRVAGLESEAARLGMNDLLEAR